MLNQLIVMNRHPFPRIDDQRGKCVGPSTWVPCHAFRRDEYPSIINGSHEPSVQTISRSVCDCFHLRHSGLVEVLRGAWDALADILANSVRALATCQAIQVRVLALWGSIPWLCGVIGRHIRGSGQGWWCLDGRDFCRHKKFRVSWVLQATINCSFRKL